MRKLCLYLIFAALATAAAGAAYGQAAPAVGGVARAVQQHLIGEVTIVNQTTGQLTVRTDSGSSVTVATNAQTVYRRLPPGQTSLEKAEAITREDVKAGDRVLVPNGLAAGQKAARQVIVMAREAIAARREQERADWRTRGANGRVVSIDQTKKELSIESRSREGAETLTVNASGNVRFRRYAPGSLKPADALPGSFADIHVGDQVRVLGNRDGSRLTAEEIISGTVARLNGIVEAADAGRGEVTVKENQTGRVVTISLVTSTMLRRIPAEFAETLRQRREQRRNEAGATTDGQTGERRAQRREQDGQGAERQRAGGRGPQGMFENMPPITIADLKKGDAVLITGTAGADASHVTAATLITGDAEVIQQLQRFQRGGPGRSGNMSPGLPGNVVGGGPGDREQP